MGRKDSEKIVLAVIGIAVLPFHLVTVIKIFAVLSNIYLEAAQEQIVFKRNKAGSLHCPRYCLF